MDEYINITLDGSFLKSAGICGLLEFLEMNKANEGTDYKVNEQSLLISKKYLQENNIPEMYVNTIAEKFKESTKFYRVVSAGKNSVDKYHNQYLNSEDEKIRIESEKKLSELYKEFEEMMLKSSFKSAMDIIALYDDIEPVNSDMITELKKIKDDYRLKYEKYHEIMRLLNQDKVSVNFIYTELLYSKFKYFFAENTTSHKITALDEKTKREDTINKGFYKPLIDEFEVKSKDKKHRCIECMGMTKNRRAISFMSDSTDDVEKKKSYYWNCKPDAYVCPLCAFLYLFVPLGFVFLCSDAVFVNTNSSISILSKFMNTYRNLSDESGSKRKRLYRVFTSQKIELLKENLSNFQVIVRSSDFPHYEMNVIDKNMIEKLHDGKKYLEWLEKKYIKTADGFISVYDNVFENILSHRSQYPLIGKLMKYEFSNDGHFGYIKNILKLEIIFNGGAEMENLKKKADMAFFAGKKMRESILGKEKANSSDNEDDNSLRGFVYRLVNLASVGDTSQFLDTIIRVYSGYNLTIPDIFKDCYQSEETFKAIAHGFILGLKYVKYEKENVSNE